MDICTVEIRSLTAVLCDQTVWSRQNHYTTVPHTVVATTPLLYTPKQLTAGRCCTKLVIIETHDLAMTNHFMNDLTDSIQVPTTFQHSLAVMTFINQPNQKQTIPCSPSDIFTNLKQEIMHSPQHFQTCPIPGGVLAKT